jgi:hypothetical protein
MEEKNTVNFMKVSSIFNALSKQVWIDTLRAIATFGVILLHISMYLLPLYNNISIKAWWFGNFIDGFCSFFGFRHYSKDGIRLLKKPN